MYYTLCTIHGRTSSLDDFATIDEAKMALLAVRTLGIKATLRSWPGVSASLSHPSPWMSLEVFTGHRAQAPLQRAGGSRGRWSF